MGAASRTDPMALRAVQKEQHGFDGDGTTRLKMGPCTSIVGGKSRRFLRVGRVWMVLRGTDGVTRCCWRYGRLYR